LCNVAAAIGQKNDKFCSEWCNKYSYNINILSTTFFGQFLKINPIRSHYRSQCRNVLNTILSNILRPVFALICFHLLAQKPNLEKFSIYSNQFFHNFHLAESSFTCPKLRASWLARTQQDSLSGMFIVLSFTYSSSDWHKNKHFVMNFWVNTPPSLVSLGLVL
jgi:hypothetical protein